MEKLSALKKALGTRRRFAVARLYYGCLLTQAKIARRLKCSQQTVSSELAKVDQAAAAAGAKVLTTLWP